MPESSRTPKMVPPGACVTTTENTNRNLTRPHLVPRTARLMPRVQFVMNLKEFCIIARSVVRYRHSYLGATPLVSDERQGALTICARSRAREACADGSANMDAEEQMSARKIL